MSYILGAIKYIKEEKTSETQELRLNRGNHKWEEDKNAKMKNNRRRKKQKKKMLGNTKYTSYRDYI